MLLLLDAITAVRMSQPLIMAVAMDRVPSISSSSTPERQEEMKAVFGPNDESESRMKSLKRAERASDTPRRGEDQLRTR